MHSRLTQSSPVMTGQKQTRKQLHKQQEPNRILPAPSPKYTDPLLTATLQWETSNFWLPAYCSVYVTLCQTKSSLAKFYRCLQGLEDNSTDTSEGP